MIRVGIVRGGTTHNESSLRSGGRVLRSFLEDLVGHYKAVDIFISTEGIWHVQGIPVEPTRLGLFVDVLFSTLTGVLPIDTDGVHLLERTLVPHTAHGSDAHETLHDYIALRTRAQEASFIVPRLVHLILTEVATPEAVAELVRTTTAQLPPPYIIRPRVSDSYHDAWIIRTSTDLLPVLTMLRDSGIAEVLIEEYQQGDMLEAHAVPEFRNAPLHVFLPLRHSAHGTSLLTGEVRKSFEDKVRALVGALAVGTHIAVFGRVHPKDGIIFTGLTTTPDLSDFSAFHGVLEANGVSFPDYLRHRVSLAKKTKKG